MSIHDPYPWVQEPGAAFEERFRRLFQEALPHLAGPKTQRPSNPPVGTMYYDTDLEKPIWWTGSHWKDATGGIV